ncbi:precursor of CEP14 [Mercurialis annua]|uniref:precursor of CEP14 n=1 Tax=Mercurialis annua TaxID=3986 RepID=UPI002160D12A|nr:precursor of CEP14 [Mercurialis annua]
MGRSTNFLLLIFLLAFATFVSNTEGRKLLLISNNSNNNNKVSTVFLSLVLSALPKGRVPSSSPSKKGHATLENQELFQRHLSSIDRILRSVPSPGVGH